MFNSVILLLSEPSLLFVHELKSLCFYMVFFLPYDSIDILFFDDVLVDFSQSVSKET